MANNGSAIYQGFLARGFGPAQAAVMAGNAQQESSFNPAAWNAASQAGGLFQWRGSRLSALQGYAAAQGKDISDPDTQMDFAVHEMAGPEAGNVKSFLAATDVPTANAAFKRYLRYGPTEDGNRLGYSMAFAGTPKATTKAAPAPDVGGQLDAIFDAPPAETPAAAAPDPAVSQSLDSIFGPDVTPAAKPGTKEYAQQIQAEVNAGKPTPQPATAPPEWQPPDVMPAPLRAFSTNAVENIPLVGGLIQKQREATETPYQAAVYQSADQQAPVAATAGKVFGEVAPLVVAGGTGIGAKALGTAADYGLGTVGNLLARTAAGGLSSAAIAGGDTLARGGSMGDAGHNALMAGGLGAAAAPVASALGSVNGLIAKSAIGAGAGAAIGGGGTLLEGGSLQDAGQNALVGAGIGGAAGAGTSVVGTLANRLMQGGIPADAAALADKAVNKFNIPLGAADISSNPLVKVSKSVVDKMPFSGGTASNAGQNAAFTGAVAKEMGTDAKALTPDVMAATRDRIGDVFDSVAQRVPAIPADPQFQNDVLKAMQDAEGSLSADKLVPFNKQVDNIMASFGPGNAITGDQFLSLTAKNSMLSKAIANGGDIGNAASDLKDALYGAMQRAAPADVLPDLQRARYQWKVMKSVQDNVAKSVDGTLSPPTLMQSVVKNFPNMAYDGGGNMGDLARIGQRFLKAPGSSQTSERDFINHLVSGGGVVGMVAAPHIAIPSVAATIGTGAAAGAAMRSRWLANSLIRGPQPFDPIINNLTRGAVPAVSGPNPLVGPLQLQ